MGYLDNIKQYLEKRKPEMVALLEALVNIDSGTGFRAGLNRMADAVVPQLQDLGFKVTRLPQEEFGDHLLARKPGSSNKRLLCIGHMDTVFSEGECERRPFRIEGDKAYGPGIIDMKGGIVVLLFSLHTLAEVDPELYKALDLTVLLNSDEEVASPTSTPFVIQEAQAADTVCVFEPARPHGEVVIKRKGAGRYFLNVYGKAAHAGAQPELGVSAIEEMARKILELHALTDFRKGITVNVGVIKGGSCLNVIAEHACAGIDVRIADQAQADHIQKAFRSISKSPQKDIRIELNGGIEFPPMLKTNRSLELLGMVQKVGNELGLDIGELFTGAASDGNRASYYAPTLDGLGPQGTGSHSPDEVLFLPTLVERTKVFVLFAREWHCSFAPKQDYPEGLTPL